MKRYKDIPVLLAFPTEHQLLGWCPYCQKIHYHGYPSGPRVAHCVTEGFKEKDYVIQKISKKLFKELTDYAIKNPISLSKKFKSE